MPQTPPSGDALAPAQGLVELAAALSDSPLIG